MADYNEKPFEIEICQHLEANGWLYSENGTGYDRERALFPEDIFGWLADTQPEQLAKIVKPTASEKDQRLAKERLLDRIVRVLGTPAENGGGTLNLLRRGFKETSAKFDMCQPRPATTHNPTTAERYAKVRVRVMRQVHYSLNNTRSLDLVLFVNGLPAATAELKTDFTQSIREAIDQYTTTRLPVDAETKKPEPLFGFGSRALVHFAVSNDEVWMSTRLAGADTRFLPFNMGDDGGEGNPPAPEGSSRSSYLWERVLQRDSWLNIIAKFMHTESSENTDPITGKTWKSTTLLFPRFHQWEAVTKLLAAARTEGPGHRYLIQHSAGSGKTNSISWTAHGLATLHDANNTKVFDSVIVVTDRTVLDDQLQDAIQQIDSTAGVVVSVTGDEAGRTIGADGQALTSKSALLAKALLDGKLIIVVTIQTFPFAMDAIRKTKGLKDKAFAVIADEAHSSQTGATANKLKEVLTAAELADIADGGEIDTEAVLSAEMTARASADNISYFAFTATPKAKMLELFGRPPAEGELPEPFHVYTMQQAIEEGYILDVLKNYTSYATAFQIAQKITKNGAGNGTTAATTVKTTAATKASADADGEAVEDEVLVDQAEATKGLMRWVKLHPTNIAQKVQIIVEHFRANAEHLLDHHAKAMVVTDSRKAAVRYKKAIDAYIAKQGYSEVTTLVAFSGEVEDPESGPERFTERNMNPGLKGRDLRSAFATNDYRVMLVANKFQTGFDQPLLVAMYVDKQLSGVTAVQTLSRLNRTYAKGGKDTTFVLDFVNDPDEILEAFKPYYRKAHLDTGSDPNLIHDLQAKLDSEGIYTEADVDKLVDAWLKKKGNSALASAIDAAKSRFRGRYVKAQQTNNKTEISTLDMFRKDVGTFIRLYDFMSQILDYGDTDLEKRAIFLRLLERQIAARNLALPVDFSDVELKHIKQNQTGSGDIPLGGDQGDGGLHGITAAGSSEKRDPKMVKLAEVLARLNELFADEDFTQSQKSSWLEGLLAALLANEMLVGQATTNSKSQFLDSPDLRNEVIAAVLGNQTSHSKMFDMFTSDGKIQVELVTGLGELLYEYAREGIG
ncbi:MAG: restriction endonuclease subunit R [Pseudonocardiales bacterium]|nr:MAG: restriction endonuclease subunit R [Pseudonocardiales bacterium]